MTTLLLTHTDCIDHTPPDGHPERPDRLRAIHAMLGAEPFADLVREDAALGDLAHVEKAHPQDYISLIEGSRPDDGLEPLDPDTWMSTGSWAAALRCIGAATRAVDAVMQRDVDNAFCAVRPPGHHAETNRAMGFCLFNSIAVGAHYARDTYDAERVAVVDFDVHHGNGTQDIFWNDADLFYASTHQMPLYPGSGARSETGVGNIFNAPLAPGNDGAQFREAMETVVLPALDTFAPDLLMISAGFDAHRLDPLANINLTEEDFAWATLELMELADRHCQGRIVSMLEGGYDLKGLTASCGVHIQALMRGGMRER